MTEEQKKEAYGENYSEIAPNPVNLQVTETSESGDLAFLRSKGIDRIELND